MFDNERGIFRVDLIRSILMRIIHNEKYPDIDKNMSDSQMGGRKGKGCRNNIFIINGIIHDVLRSKKKKPVLLQIYDYAQIFDSINLKQAISDVYEMITYLLFKRQTERYSWQLTPLMVYLSAKL